MSSCSSVAEMIEAGELCAECQRMLISDNGLFCDAGHPVYCKDCWENLAVRVRKNASHFDPLAEHGAGAAVSGGQRGVNSRAMTTNQEWIPFWRRPTQEQDMNEINTDPIYDIRVAVATALRRLGVQGSHKQITDGIVDELPDFFRKTLQAANDEDRHQPGESND